MTTADMKKKTDNMNACVGEYAPLGSGLFGLLIVSRYISNTALKELNPKERKASTRAGAKIALKSLRREMPDVRIMPERKPRITTRDNSRLNRSGKAASLPLGLTMLKLKQLEVNKAFLLLWREDTWNRPSRKWPQQKSRCCLLSGPRT